MTLPQREHHTDPFDIAADMARTFRDQAIAAARSKVKQDQSPDKDGILTQYDCEACGNEIGEGRLKAASRNLLCIHCATREERLKR